MNPRLVTAITVSAAVHACVWIVYFWQVRPSHGPQAPRFENSIMIDPAAMEAVRKARASAPKKKAVKPPPAPPAPPKKVEPPPAAVIRKAEAPKTPVVVPPPKTPAPSSKQAVQAEKAAKVAAAAQALSATAAPSAPGAGEKNSAELMANPSTRGLFTDYFGLVKGKIQAKLREKCRGLQLGRGSVELSFILLSDGRLYRLNIVERSAQVHPELKRLALESLRESAPFQNFPSDFKARQLAFNLTVHFDDL